MNYSRVHSGFVPPFYAPNYYPEQRVPVGHQPHRPFQISRFCLPIIFCGIAGGTLFACAGDQTIVPVVVGAGIGLGSAFALVGIISAVALSAIGIALLHFWRVLLD